jgi:hypothetical protein
VGVVFLHIKHNTLSIVCTQEFVLALSVCLFRNQWILQVKDQTNGQVEFPEENSVTLFDFYCQLTKCDPTMTFIGDRNFQQMYLAASTISDKTLEDMRTIFSTSEHKAFNMKQFVALHAFDAKKYGGTSDMNKSYEFQVTKV